MVFDVVNKGQVFTPVGVVERMVGLIQNGKNILEPSCGEGSFLNVLPSDAIGVEIEKGLCSSKHKNIDFFDYLPKTKHDTIIGNPPYVRHQDILKRTQSKLDYTFFDKRNQFVFVLYEQVY